MRQYYKIGSRGPDVEECQKALNEKLDPSHNLVVDGQYGRNTYLAVIAFQQKNFLQVDGIIGPNTSSALLVNDDGYTVIDHGIKLVPQFTPMTCWAASLAMITRTNINHAFARTPKDMIGPDLGVSNFSGEDNSTIGNQRFARAHNLRYYPPQTHTQEAFLQLVRNGPIMLSMLNSKSRYLTKWGSSGHRIVIGGFRTRGGTYGEINTPDGPYFERYRAIKVFDPWPVGRGRVEWVTVKSFAMRYEKKVPTFGIFTM